MQKTTKKIQDETTAEIYAALKKAFPGLPDEPDRVVYRINPVAVRVRIISPKFRGKSMAQREEMVNKAWRSLPENVVDDVTLILMMTPEEAKRPELMYYEFDEPTGSYL